MVHGITTKLLPISITFNSGDVCWWGCVIWQKYHNAQRHFLNRQNEKKTNVAEMVKKKPHLKHECDFYPTSFTLCSTQTLQKCLDMFSLY